MSFCVRRPAGAGRSRPVALATLLWLAALLLGLLAPSAPAQGSKEKGPQLDAAAWILVDARDGTRLAAKAPNERRSIASTTKLMTTYVALEELDLDEKLTVPAYDALPAESVAGLTQGEKLTVADLIRAMMLPSANDAAATVATGVGGSPDRFVAQMNEAAADIGLRDSSFANPVGLDDPNNYSTAADLVTLAIALRENKFFRKTVDTPEVTLESGSVPRTLTTRNTLLLSDPSVDGIKTGHTIDAGYVLVASAKREGVPLVSVVLGAASEAGRDVATAELLDYGYSLYEKRSPFKRREVLAESEVHYEDDPLPLVAARAVEVSARKDQELETAVDAPLEVEGPIAKGEKLGVASVTLDGDPVGKVPLLASQAVAEPTLIDRIGGPVVVVAAAIVLIVILLVVVVLLRRRTRTKREAVRSPEERMRSQQERISRRGNGGEI